MTASFELKHKIIFNLFFRSEKAMLSKLVDSERQFVKDYQSVFPNRLAYFVQLYQLWNAVTVIDEQTGCVSKALNKIIYKNSRRPGQGDFKSRDSWFHMKT